MYAAYQTWLHTECGLDKRDQAQYTPRELQTLQLGWAVREHGAVGGSTSASVRNRKAELEKHRQSARQELLDDVNGQSETAV